MKQLEEKIFYSIKEVSENLQVSYSYLRFLENEIPGLVVKRNSKKTRFYSKENISYIKQILHYTQKLGISIKAAEIKINAERLLQNHPLQIIDELKATKLFLERLKNEIEQ